MLRDQVTLTTTLRSCDSVCLLRGSYESSPFGRTSPSFSYRQTFGCSSERPSVGTTGDLEPEVGGCDKLIYAKATNSVDYHRKTISSGSLVVCSKVGVWSFGPTGSKGPL